MNKKAFNALPDDLKAIVTAVVAKYTQDQHEFLVSESIKAVEKFKAAGNEVYKVPTDIVDALKIEADKFYAEKSKSEEPIFAEIYNSMKSFGDAYSAIK